MKRDDHVAVLVAFSGDGGVENMVVNLVSAWLAQGVRVDVVLIKSRGGHVQRLPAGATVFRLNALTTLTALPRIVGYLRTSRPPALLAVKDRAARAAIVARAIAGVPCRVVIRLGMHLSGSLAGKTVWRRWSRWLPVRWVYPHADRIITVSNDISDDLVKNAGLARDLFATLPNPVITPDFDQRMAAPLAHRWFDDGGPPVILGVGRLRPQKDFVTLLRAVGKLAMERSVRLVILGEGPQRASLIAWRDRLGLRDTVDLPGFVQDPLPWMARADAFVLSSAFEGSPNVLVEAMACGTPVVATDCPSGPRSILRHGALGPLVPVGDAAAMKRALAAVLDEPTPAGVLREAVGDFSAEASARRYGAILGLSTDTDCG